MPFGFSFRDPLIRAYIERCIWVHGCGDMDVDVGIDTDVDADINANVDTDMA